MDKILHRVLIFTAGGDPHPRMVYLDMEHRETVNYDEGQIHSDLAEAILSKVPPVEETDLHTITSLVIEPSDVPTVTTAEVAEDACKEQKHVMESLRDLVRARDKLHSISSPSPKVLIMSQKILSAIHRGTDYLGIATTVELKDLSAGVTETVSMTELSDAVHSINCDIDPKSPFMTLTIKESHHFTEVWFAGVSLWSTEENYERENDDNTWVPIEEHLRRKLKIAVQECIALAKNV